MAIELAGAAPVIVEVAELPVWSFSSAGGPSVGTFEARVNIHEGGTFLSWAMSLAQRQVVKSAGSVVVVGQNLDRLHRFDWPGAALTELVLSTLDAAESKKLFTATLKWQPNEVIMAKDSGTLQGTPAKKQKAWLCSNFRVKLSGLPHVESKVVKVELPKITGTPAASSGTRRTPAAPVVAFGPLRLTVSGAGIDAVRDWVQSIIKHGGVTPADMQTVTIDMLDAALKKSLGTVTVQGCELRAWEEDPLTTTAMLTFAVQGMDLRSKA
jgi:hypothetical protein